MPITHALYERPEIDTVSRPLAPEDIRVGMYLSTLAECQELWPWLITVEDILYDRVKPLRYTERPKCNDDPVIVVEVCLPFVLVETARKKTIVLDTRQSTLTQMSERFGREAFKRMREEKARKQQQKSEKN